MNSYFYHAAGYEFYRVFGDWSGDYTADFGSMYCAGGEL